MWNLAHGGALACQRFLGQHPDTILVDKLSDTSRCIVRLFCTASTMENGWKQQTKQRVPFHLVMGRG